MPSPIKIVSTKPYTDQRPGTSGLRKSVTVFQQPHYVENFIQSYFNTIKNEDPEKDLWDYSFFVGGDGRFLMRSCVNKIIQIAAANQVCCYIE
ncbi:hypothetical protein GJ496_011216 [Pomphorhynchus laevis]|nr:hypothetical protein GJ496_011216 [Pomphorhynchus laevis]